MSNLFNVLNQLRISAKSFTKILNGDLDITQEHFKISGDDADIARLANRFPDLQILGYNLVLKKIGDSYYVMDELVTTDEDGIVDEEIRIPFLAGYESSGTERFIDLSNTHLLLSGSTQSGKSTMMQRILKQVLEIDDSLVALIDFSKREFNERHYGQIRKLAYPVIHEFDSAKRFFGSLKDFMDKRNDRYIDNEKNFSPVFIFVDEVQLLVDDAKASKDISHIARLGAGVGIHLIIATQYPTGDTVTRDITQNCKRIAFQLMDAVAYKVALGHQVPPVPKNKLYINDGRLSKLKRVEVDKDKLLKQISSQYVGVPNYLFSPSTLTIEESERIDKVRQVAELNDGMFSGKLMREQLSGNPSTHKIAIETAITNGFVEVDAHGEPVKQNQRYIFKENVDAFAAHPH